MYPLKKRITTKLTRRFAAWMGDPVQASPHENQRERYQIPANDPMSVIR